MEPPVLTEGDLTKECRQVAGLIVTGSSHPAGFILPIHFFILPNPWHCAKRYLSTSRVDFTRAAPPKLA